MPACMRRNVVDSNNGCRSAFRTEYQSRSCTESQGHRQAAPQGDVARRPSSIQKAGTGETLIGPAVTLALFRICDVDDMAQAASK